MGDHKLQRQKTKHIMKTTLVLFSIINYLMPSLISGEGSYCSADKCVNIQPIEAWFEKVADPQYGINSKIDKTLTEDAEPLVKIVPCETQNALWKYKYTGSKGK